MMLNWLRGLMAGDQDSVPPDANVTRDALGRVVGVTQTLSPPGGAIGSDVPVLAIEADLRALLPVACDWAITQNQLLVRQYGVGAERSFLFDQEEGSLVLTFADGRRLTFDAQVIGSFDPADRSFLWGWANPSIRPALTTAIAALRDQPPAPGHNPFAIPRHTITFDDLTALLALVGQIDGSDGVYRCIGDSGSLFLSIRVQASEPVQPNVAPAVLDEALATVAAYDAEMLPFDRIYADTRNDDHEADTPADPDGPTGSHTLVAGKVEVYRRYWTRDDDYWEPCSLGWPSDHDPATFQLRFAAPHGVDGLLCVTIGQNSARTIYHLRRVDGELRIVDQLLDWGDGLIWPAV